MAITTGKVIVNAPCIYESDSEIEKARIILAVEQFLNGTVASHIYRQFNIGVRFHLGGDNE